MSPRVPLSPGEWLLFAAIARERPPEGATASWVRDRIPKSDGQAYALTTVITLLSRLRDKGWVRVEYEDPASAPPQGADPTHSGARRPVRTFYFPTVPYEEALRELVEHFLEVHQLEPGDIEKALPLLPT